MTIKFQNEFLLASLEGEILVTTPDLIVLLEDETYTPLTTDSIKYGIRVIAIGVPCNKCWRSKHGLELVGPSYFGYETEYVPLEKRITKRLRAI